MTIFARNPDTGKAKWAYQKTPHDAWDYDGINESVLVDVNIKGKVRKALVNFDRNGFVYTLDRETGELLGAEPFVHVTWAKGVDMKTGRPIEVPEKRTSSTKNTKNICPSAMGGKNPKTQSYKPAAKPFKEEELASLLAPIALYPDQVIAQVLMASTYPLEVVEAYRWVQANSNMNFFFCSFLPTEQFFKLKMYFFCYQH